MPCQQLNSSFSYTSHLFIGNDEQQYIGFENEKKESELRMLTIGDFKRVTLRLLWFRCRLIEDSSWYIGCNGTEIPFKSSLFSIERGANLHSFPYFLKVRKSSSFDVYVCSIAFCLCATLFPPSCLLLLK